MTRVGCVTRIIIQYQDFAASGNRVNYSKHASLKDYYTYPIESSNVLRLCKAAAHFSLYRDVPKLHHGNANGN